ncbi:MAG TPA: ABC transporter substrate-binding protein [Acetobacteraceae bacterium]|nr:ABC transporter substrate-binding protein [Acetobacteraceae bacterium]
MSELSRRSVLQATLGLAAGGALARPYIANAAATTATAWFTQGFVPEEDAALKQVVADYEKQSGNKIDLSIVPFAPLAQKIISALTTGAVPDIMSHDVADALIIPQNAWHDKLIDLSEICEQYKAQYLPTVNLAAQYYNAVTKKRGYYLAPHKTACIPIHVWGDLVKEAGYNMADAPKTWTAFWNWFKPMQAILRNKGHRGFYVYGMQITSTGPADGNNFFYGQVLARGGQNFMTSDGKAHFDDPQVKEAVIKTIEFTTSCYKEGYVPPGVLSWNDADDNNAFHAKTILMDFDGTISTEVAMYHNKQNYDDAVTLGLPLSDNGQATPAEVGAGGCFMAKGCKNEAVGKDFIKYITQPKVAGQYLKAGLGRWLPCMPEIVKNDPWWMADPHRKPYVTEGLLMPSVPFYYVYNPGIAVANAQQIWGQMQADVIRNGVKPQDAAAKGFSQIQAIVDQYKIVQS